MKISEFIKKHGWDVARQLIEKRHQSVCQEYLLEKYGYIVETKCYLIVEFEKYLNAYDLVQSYGGLDLAIYIRNHNMVVSEHTRELKQAIKLVEEIRDCQQ